MQNEQVRLRLFVTLVRYSLQIREEALATLFQGEFQMQLNNSLPNGTNTIADSFRSSNLTVAQIEILARTQRAQMIAEMVADAVIWLGNLPSKLKTEQLRPAAR
jgi:hypothetical protein